MYYLTAFVTSDKPENKKGWIKIRPVLNPISYEKPGRRY